MDLNAETAAYEAEIEVARGALDVLAVAYAEAMGAVSALVTEIVDAQNKFAACAEILNAEAARQGLPAVVTVPDVPGEADIALVLRGVQLPDEMTFTAQARRAGEARG
ncbi:hypothetical protein GXW83_27465 [Streptacidiphilus sp. PB12-B1b]|uniref:hypothetical protein n=1 Tax=Streptacidiphilus sp. PB12-B1b TaxID=2705012 RepID=UPI0015FD3BD6|nr:hypothetical protein [Streptacidiphilus sp. PB12-B1b]QMU78884.1 hypothetical protein GXW83_27465 [Streptacidiphilus sp. PB12-B1b]